MIFIVIINNIKITSEKLKLFIVLYPSQMLSKLLVLRQPGGMTTNCAIFKNKLTYIMAALYSTGLLTMEDKILEATQL